MRPLMALRTRLQPSFARTSQWGIEDRIGEVVDLSRPGFFCEAGAADGLSQSNTYWLERVHGWRGALVEPIPAMAERCRANRPGSHVTEAALGGPDRAGETVTLRFAGLMTITEGGFGTPDEEDAYIERGLKTQGIAESYRVEVPVRTLESVLDEAGAPEDLDFLSLDIEGYEAAVLRGLGRFAPRAIVIEMIDGDGVEETLAELGYRCADRQFTEMDALFVRENKI
jgi:FkbM family methyltransferase